jgi:hypothetical protein
VHDVVSQLQANHINILVRSLLLSPLLVVSLPHVQVEQPAHPLAAREQLPPLLSVDQAQRTVTVVVDHRNAAAFFPSMPDDMRR